MEFGTLRPAITLVHVYEAAIGNSDFVPIDLPAGISCKSALIKCRLATNKWFMSSQASPGTDYITFEAGTSYTVDISKAGSNTLCFIKGTAAADSIEVSLGREAL